MALRTPGQTHGVSLFVDPLIAGLGISRTQISTAYLTGTRIGACAMPAAGKAVDRYGPRWVMAAIAPCSAPSCLRSPSSPASSA
ncbi:hypothetical protein ACHZ98_12870 [Streptomyces sp. MAR4 CNY-716]